MVLLAGVDVGPGNLGPLPRIVGVRRHEVEVLRVHAGRVPQAGDLGAEQEVHRLDAVGVGGALAPPAEGAKELRRADREARDGGAVEPRRFLARKTEGAVDDERPDRGDPIAGRIVGVAGVQEMPEAVLGGLHDRGRVGLRQERQQGLRISIVELGKLLNRCIVCCVEVRHLVQFERLGQTTHPVELDNRLSRGSCACAPPEPRLSPSSYNRRLTAEPGLYGARPRSPALRTGAPPASWSPRFV